MSVDMPKSLASQTERLERLALLREPHVAPLTAFVEGLRRQLGAQYKVPYFDPHDGGVEAECLFLLEAPGPRAVWSGFVSRNNPDETAKNFLLLSEEASIPRRCTAIWNIVPWYIGCGSRIRPATQTDISAALPSLRELFRLLVKLRVVALVGKKAASAEPTVRSLAPGVRTYAMPHPSPMFVNRSPGNRLKLLEHLKSVASVINGGMSAG